MQPEYDDKAIKAYLDHEMSEEDHDDFEIAMFEDPALFERVKQLDPNYGQFATQLAENALTIEEGSKEKPSANKREDENQTFTRWIMDLIATPAWSMAASMVAVVAVAVLFVGGDRTGSSQLVDEIVYVETLRSSDRPTIGVSANKLTLLAIDAIQFENAPQTIISLASGNQEIQQWQAGSPDANLQFNVLLPALGPGAYVLSVGEGKDAQRWNLAVQ